MFSVINLPIILYYSEKCSELHFNWNTTFYGYDKTPECKKTTGYDNCTLDHDYFSTTEKLFVINIQNKNSENLYTYMYHYAIFNNNFSITLLFLLL